MKLNLFNSRLIHYKTLFFLYFQTLVTTTRDEIRYTVTSEVDILSVMFQVVLTCNVPDHHFLYSLAYDALLIILCTIYAVKTRKVQFLVELLTCATFQVPENFNETKWIGFAMYTTCVIWLTWVFFFIGTGSDFQVNYFEFNYAY